MLLHETLFSPVHAIQVCSQYDYCTFICMFNTTKNKNKNLFSVFDIFKNRNLIILVYFPSLISSNLHSSFNLLKVNEEEKNKELSGKKYSKI